MFSKVKKEVLFVFSRSAVSFEGSGATDWRAGGRSVGRSVGRSTVRQVWCEQDDMVLKDTSTVAF